MQIPKQKTFGEFIADRYGPKWVYAHRTTDRIRRQYPESVVITPKQQRELTTDYQKEWGREYDPEFWAMLCALRAINDTSFAKGAPLGSPTYFEIRQLAVNAIKTATGT